MFLHTFGPGITDLAGLSERRTPQTRGSAKFSKRIDRIDSTTTAVDYLLIYTDDKTFPEPFFPRYRRVFFLSRKQCTGDSHSSITHVSESTLHGEHALRARRTLVPYKWLQYL